MASTYGRNFGFRRSDEAFALREGRFKTPASGNELLQGSAVQIDPASAGYMKACAAKAAPLTGLTGLLVQEEDHFGSVFEAAPLLGHDSLDQGTCKKDRLSVIWAGAGTKVWFKNTKAYSRGSRSKAAVDIVDLTGVAVGDSLGWDGTKWVKAVPDTPASGEDPAVPGTPAWMTVTHLNGTDYCEAVLTF